MSGKPAKILAAGSPILDILVNVDDAFIQSIGGSKGGMELVSSERLDDILSRVKTEKIKAPGGSAGNTIFGLAKLGLPTSFLGKIGRDEDGDFYKKRLSILNGDIKSFRYADNIHTGRCLSLVTPDSERTMRTDLGAAALLGPEDVTENDFSGVSHVHVEGYMLYAEPLCRKVLSEAKKAGATVSLDLASFEVVRNNKNVLPELLKNYIDIIFANEDEAKEFCGISSPEEALNILSGYSRTVAVKLGKKGALIKSGNSSARVNAEIVKAVDTTGAGDLWQTGFLYGFLQGMPLETCGKFGSILGAEVVQVMGAEIPDERWNAILGKLKQLK